MGGLVMLQGGKWLWDCDRGLLRVVEGVGI